MSGRLRAWRAGLSPGWFALHLVVAATTALLLLPILVIIPISFSASRYLAFPPTEFSLEWYRRLIDRPEWLRALQVSVQTASVCTVLSCLLGIPAALALVRGRFPAKGAIHAILLTPMILPHVVIALSCFLLFSRLHLTGNALGIALGHTIIVVPIVVIVVSSALQAVDQRIEQAAELFGASPLQVFSLITLPLVRPGLVAAALFAFLLSFDELIIALFLADPTSTTLPIQIWNDTVYQVSPTIAAVSSILILFSAGVLFTLSFLRR
jgi:putative spermidine/putrescine transport system permease protein